MEKWNGVREISDTLERRLESFNLSSFGHMEHARLISGIPENHAAVMFDAPASRIKCLICSLMHALSDADRPLSQQPQSSCSAARVRPRHRFGNGTIFSIGYLASHIQFGKEPGIRSRVIAAQRSVDIRRCKPITKKDYSQPPTSNLIPQKVLWYPMSSFHIRKSNATQYTG
jgi:hypothetical protein